LRAGSELPVRLSANRSVPTTWSYGVTGSGNGTGWNVFSFVRTSNTTSVNLNLRDFTGNLVNRGWLSSKKYLTSVQAGTEVFTGNGQLNTESYWVDVQ
jgi:hypothetical protein